jgi:hypothetical protein
MPAMRAIYPCLCLCFWLLQMMRTTPSRRTTLHFTQIFLTDERTFMSSFNPGDAPSHPPDPLLAPPK